MVPASATLTPKLVATYGLSSLALVFLGAGRKSHGSSFMRCARDGS